MSAERAPRKPGSRRVPLTSARSIGWLSIAVVFVISLLRLAGGLLHLTLLMSVAPAWTEMKTITMVCFLSSAGALMLIYLRPADTRRSIGAILLGGIVALVGLVTIAAYVSDLVVGQAWGVTQAPFLNLLFATHTRMALITAAVFTLVGLTLVLLAMGSRRAAHVAHALAFPAVIASYMVLVSYLLGVQSMSAVMGTAMALNTGIAFCFLSLAAFCARTDTWLMKALTGGEIGGYMARRLLPALMATPLVIGWLRLQGERTGLFSSEVGVALVVTAYTVVFVILVLLAARAANRTDARRRVAERAVRESEEQFRAVSESSAVQLVVTRLSDNVILFTNAAFDQAFGYARGELVGRSAPEMYVDPTDRAALIRAVDEQGLAEHFEVRVKKRDGTQFWCSTSVRRLQFAGAPAILGAAIDITARKRAEEELRLSEQRFALSFANNPAAIALTRLEDGVFLDVNDTWTALNGYSREEAIGHSARQMRIWPSAESASRFIEELKSKGTLRGWEQEFLTKSGDVYVAELSAQALIIRGEKVILSTLVDITARKRAEEKLRETTERFQTIFDHAPIAIYVKDREGRFVFGNRKLEQYAGRPLEHLLGMTDYDFASKEEADRWRENDLTVLAGQEAEYEETGTNRDGRPYTNLSVKFPLTDPAGTPVELCGISMDITERKRADESLRRNEATLRGILDATQESIWLFSADGVVLQANATALKRFGKSWSEVVGKSLEEILPPELAKLRRVRLQEVVETARPVDFEDERAGMQFRHSFYPVLDGEGHVTAVASFSRDITESRRAEQALRESESKFRIVADNTYDFEFWLDPDRRYIYASPSCERITGYKPAEFLADPELRFRIAHPEDRQMLIDHARGAERDEPGVLDHRIIHRDGSVRWIGHVCQPIFDASGRFLGTRGSNRDITGRKRNEARVARLAKLYAVLSRVNETIVRTRDAGTLYSEVCRIVSEEGGFPLVWVGRVDGKQVVPVACSGAACDYLKEVRVETEGELGKGPTGVSIREGRAVVNDDFAANPATAPWRQSALRYGFRASASFPLRQNGKVIGAFTLYSSQPGEFDAEQVRLFEALSADLSYALDAIDQERLRVQADEALCDAKETLEVRVKERTAELSTEIDERMRAEERLAATSQYVRSLIESSLDPLVTINAEGRITDVNEATVKVTGATRVELIGTDFSEYFTEPEKAREGYQRVFAKQHVTDYPLTIRHRDGRLTDVLYNASVYRDAKGNTIGVFAAARDITARKQAEQALQKAYDTLEVKVAARTAELKRSNEELEQFAYVASHDLQEPLRMVASYVQLLGQRYKGQLDEKADKYIAYASGGAVRMHQLVNDLLAFSRVGTRAEPMAPVSLDRAVAQTLENLTVAIEQSGAVVEVGPMPTVFGDETQLVQLFQNLVDNAIKFHGPEPPRIRITADYADFADNSERKHDKLGIPNPSRSPSGATSSASATSAVHTGSLSGPRSVESAQSVDSSAAIRPSEPSATSASSAVKSSADSRPGFVTVRVSDNGIGIDPKHRDRIFRLFQRLHSEQEYSGTGIGLAVCKKIVERHGGCIWVEPAEGGGSVFQFTLPKKKEAEAKVEVKPEEPGTKNQEPSTKE